MPDTTLVYMSHVPMLYKREPPLEARSSTVMEQTEPVGPSRVLEGGGNSLAPQRVQANLQDMYPN